MIVSNVKAIIIMLGFIISLLFSFPVIFLLSRNGSIIWLVKKDATAAATRASLYEAALSL